MTQQLTRSHRTDTRLPYTTFFGSMLHNPRMAGARGDAEKTDAPAGAWLAGLRAATRAIVDYALPPRCPGCGVIVGDDRQFCLACWSSLDFLGGPGCVHCSIPLPQTMPSGEIA